jgi:hypothetical protein
MADARSALGLGVQGGARHGVGRELRVEALDGHLGARREPAPGPLEPRQIDGGRRAGAEPRDAFQLGEVRIPPE